MPTKSTMRLACDKARNEILDRVHLDPADIPDSRNYVVRRRGGPEKLCVSNSILIHGAEFTNMVIVFTAMTGGPWPGDSVRGYKVIRSGQEGSFFYLGHLVRWYIDFRDEVNPSIYITIDKRSAWWQRLMRTLSVMKKRRNRLREQRKRMAA